MKIVFQDPTFSLQLLRAIGESYYKSADIGECLSTAYRIREGDLRVGTQSGSKQQTEFINMQRIVLQQVTRSVHARLICVLQIITG